MPAMTQTPARSFCRTRLAWLRRTVGALTAVLLFLSLGEIYLRIYPPPYLHPFLGEASPLSGHLVPDPDFGVGFASWDDLVKDNPVALGPDSLLRPDASPGLPSNAWLVLGNSFGFELSVRLQREFPEHVTLNLDRREKLTVRMAQIKTLLESGCRPEHIFLVVIPNDFNYLVEHGLDRHTANGRGGYVIQPRLPGGLLRYVLTSSRLAFCGWTRLGYHCDNPSYKKQKHAQHVPESLRRDQEHLFGALASYQRKHQVPVTVILIPSQREMVQKQGFAVEDTPARILKTEGLDYLDPRPAFLAESSQQELYVPDGHLSEAGNMLVVRELRKHLARQDALRADAAVQSTGGDHP